MTDTTAADAIHKRKMQHRKQVIDARIAQASTERGIIVINTGNGKGKSSSAFGMVARALGHKMNVGVVQFIKGAQPTGEEAFYRRFPEQVQFHVMGEGFTWETQDKQRDIEKAEAAWDKARELLDNESIQVVVLDELNIALRLKYLDLDTVIDDLLKRPVHQHVIITGRGAAPELIEIADTVSEIKEVKHAFKAGIKAQAGIEM